MSAPKVIWLDMQLPPALCRLVAEQAGLPCQHIADLGMHRAPDDKVFEAARAAEAVVITKDSDFPRLLDARGAPPAVVWLRCGNCPTTAVRTLLSRFLPQAIEMIRAGNALVEISYSTPGSTNEG